MRSYPNSIIFFTLIMFTRADIPGVNERKDTRLINIWVIRPTERSYKSFVYQQFDNNLMLIFSPHCLTIRIAVTVVLPDKI